MLLGGLAIPLPPECGSLLAKKLMIESVSSKTDKPMAQVQKLIALLEAGPQFVEDLEKELGLIRSRLHTLIYLTKQSLKKIGQTIRLDKGNKGKGDVYALRDIGEIL